MASAIVDAREISKAFVIVGRQKDCDVVLKDDGVSRKHLKLFLGDQGLRVEDLGAANGLSLNDVLVTSKTSRAIKAGDSLKLPGTDIEIVLERVDYVAGQSDEQVASDPAKTSQAKTRAGGGAASEVPASPASHVAEAQARLAVELQKKHAEHEKKMEALESQRREVEDTHRDLDAKHRNLDTKHRDLDGRYRDLEAKHGVLEAKHRSLEATNHSLGATNHELQIKQGELEVKRRDLQREYDRASFEFEKFETLKKTERGELESELVKKQSLVNLLKQSVQELSSSAEERKRQFLGEDLERQRQKKEFEQFLEDFQQTRSKESELKAHCARLEQEQQASEVKIAAQQQKLEELQTSWQKLSEEKIGVERKIADERLQHRLQMEAEAQEAKRKHLANESLEAEQKLLHLKLLSRIEEKNTELLSVVREKTKVELQVETKNAEWEKISRGVSEGRVEVQKNQETLSRLAHDLESARALAVQEQQKATHELDLLTRELRGKQSESLTVQADLQKLRLHHDAEKLRLAELVIEKERVTRHQESELLKRQTDFDRWKDQETQLFKQTLEQQRSSAAEKLRLENTAWRNAEELKIQETLKAGLRKAEKEILSLKQGVDADLKKRTEAQAEELERRRALAEANLTSYLEARERFLLDGISAAFRQSAKEEAVALELPVLNRLETKAQALIKGLLQAKGEEGLAALGVDQNSWLLKQPKKSLYSQWKVPAWSAGALAGLALVWGLVSSPTIGVKNWIQGMDRQSKAAFDEVMAQKKRDSLAVYLPVQDRVYKDNFVDNVVFLEGYAQLKTTEEFQKKYILKVNEFFTNEIPGGDRKAPLYLAAEASMINDLMQELVSINPKNPQPGIERLRLLESAAKEKLIESAGTPKQFEKIKKIDETLYGDFVRQISGTPRLPASTGP